MVIVLVSFERLLMYPPPIIISNIMIDVARITYAVAFTKKLFLFWTENKQLPCQVSLILFAKYN